MFLVNVTLLKTSCNNQKKLCLLLLIFRDNCFSILRFCNNYFKKYSFDHICVYGVTLIPDLSSKFTLDKLKLF